MVQDELETHAEVLRGDGIGTGSEERFVHLTVIVGGESEELAERIVCGETNLNGFVSAGGLRDARQDVSVERGLVAKREVQAQVEVVGEAFAVGGCFLLSFLSLGAHGTFRGEEVEVCDFVAQSDDEIIGFCFAQLLRSHAEREHAGFAHLHLGCEVVLEGHVDAHERRETLVDADGRDVIH